MLQLAYPNGSGRLAWYHGGLRWAVPVVLVSAAMVGAAELPTWAPLALQQLGAEKAQLVIPVDLPDAAGWSLPNEAAGPGLWAALAVSARRTWVRCGGLKVLTEANDQVEGEAEASSDLRACVSLIGSLSGEQAATLQRLRPLPLSSLSTEQTQRLTECLKRPTSLRLVPGHERPQTHLRLFGEPVLRCYRQGRWVADLSLTDDLFDWQSYDIGALCELAKDQSLQPYPLALLYPHAEGWLASGSYGVADLAPSTNGVLAVGLAGLQVAGDVRLESAVCWSLEDLVTSAGRQTGIAMRVDAQIGSRRVLIGPGAYHARDLLGAACQAYGIGCRLVDKTLFVAPAYRLDPRQSTRREAAWRANRSSAQVVAALLSAQQYPGLLIPWDRFLARTRFTYAEQPAGLRRFLEDVWQVNAHREDAPVSRAGVPLFGTQLTAAAFFDRVGAGGDGSPARMAAAAAMSQMVIQCEVGLVIECGSYQRDESMSRLLAPQADKRGAQLPQLWRLTSWRRRAVWPGRAGVY